MRSLRNLTSMNGHQSLPTEEKTPKDDKDGTFAKMMHKLHFLLEIIAGIDLLVVFLASSILTLSVIKMGNESAWLKFLSESKPAISTLGAFYSFALVFRTNICYARWWEGRTLWGAIIVHSIRIGQQGRLWIQDESLVDRICCLATTFGYACKAQLRGNAIEDDVEDGAKLVNRGVLSQEELNAIASQKAWQPYYCIDALRATINNGLLKGCGGNTNDWLKNAAHSAMEETICSLATSIGSCIRVRSTGLPTAYDDILYTIGGIFFTSACIAWAPGAGFYNPIIVLTIYIVVKMIIGVGNDMEDPFGHDESDLPLEAFCATIEMQLNAINMRADNISFNLAYGPSKSKASSFRRLTTSTSSSIGSSCKADDIELGVDSETNHMTGSDSTGSFEQEINFLPQSSYDTFSR